MKTNYFFAFFVCISCAIKPSQGFVEHQFIFQNEKRQLSLHFIDNSNVVIRDFFDCDIDSVLQTNLMLSKYHIRNKMIYLEDTKEHFIPYVEDEDCFFLSAAYRSKKRRYYPGGPLVKDSDETLYELPKIDKLLILNDSTLVFYKTLNASKSMGFMFKKVK